MQQGKASLRWYDLSLLLLGLLLFTANIGGFSIYIVDEARNATAAYEMYERGDWIVPTYNGELRMDKPPLHYYVMRAGYVLFGKSPFSARLGSALCGFLTFLLLWRVAANEWNARAGRFTAFIYLAALYVPIQFHLATPDPYLALCFTAALLGLFIGWRDGKLGWQLTAYVLLGLGMLAKGPVAPALGALSVLVFLVWSRSLRWSDVWRFRPVLGGLILLAVALPWFAAVHFQTDGAWTRGFFLEHNLERFADTKEGHGGIFLLIPAIVLLGMLPFGLWIPEAIVRQWRRQPDLMVFASSVVLAVVGFFSVSQTKLPSYPFPAFGFAALLLGAFFDQWVDRPAWQNAWPSRVGLMIVVLIALALPVGFHLGFQQHPDLGHIAELYLWILPLSGLTILGAFLIWRNRAVSGILSLGGGFIYVNAIFFWVLLPAIDQANQVNRSLALLKEQEVAYYQRFAQGYAFYLDGPKQVLEDVEALEQWRMEHPRDTLYLVTTKRSVRELPSDVLGALIFQQKDLFERPVTEIYRYLPNE